MSGENVTAVKSREGQEGYSFDLCAREKCVMIEIRTAEKADAKRLLEIYDYYVANTAVSFEYETPSLDEFTERMERALEKYPYLVLERDERIEGYAYAGPFKGRAAYGWSCEISIYLDRSAQKCGLGRMLSEALEEALKKMGILNIYGCIAYPEKNDEYLTTNSADYHAHLGFVKVGEFRRCAYKFGRWYNMIWMEKTIGEHADKPAAVRRYSELY